jgi:hypothetical protein
MKISRFQHFSSLQRIVFKSPFSLGGIEIAGDFNLQTRTASRYDDREVLHFPAFKVW